MQLGPLCQCQSHGNITARSMNTKQEKSLGAMGEKHRTGRVCTVAHSFASILQGQGPVKLVLVSTLMLFPCAAFLPAACWGGIQKRFMADGHITAIGNGMLDNLLHCVLANKNNPDQHLIYYPASHASSTPSKYGEGFCLCYLFGQLIPDPYCSLESFCFHIILLILERILRIHAPGLLYLQMWERGHRVIQHGYRPFNSTQILFTLSPLI
ncbi:uncharacterized protein [Narcine bancroftii]|uniref:uncharacterized protein n=1 Tax=Narcine bancroftii TaxID=1343680 RepID=UPI0038312AE6